MVQGLSEDDLVIALISGGGSSLLSLPAPGLTLEDKQAVNRALLRSGAHIGEMNCVRKHLSAIKGGRLAAAAYPARDGHAGHLGRARGRSVGHRLRADRRRYDHLRRRARGARQIRDHRARARRCAIWSAPRMRRRSPAIRASPARDTVMIATPQMSLEAAAAVARDAGITPLILGDSIEGEAREVGRVMAGIARQVALRDQPAPNPAVLLSGGETTVTVRGKGRGGRNVEFLLRSRSS